ncbi:MAG: transporter substrate-binding domain-containing protein [Acidimicrobiales bacterium]
MTPNPSLHRLVPMLLVALLFGAACSAASEEAFTSNLPDAEAAPDGDASAAPDPDPACDASDPTPSIGPAEPLPGPSNLPPGSYMEEIRSRGVLRAGVGVDTLLFGFLNPQTGNIEGFDVEMARLVADAIFGDPDKVELVPVTSAERIEAITSGDVDLVVKTMTINCERWASINFSTVYYESGQRLLVGAQSGVGDIESLDDQPICAVSGTTSLANLESAGITTIETTGWTECLVAFQQGRAFGVSTDDTILAGLAAQDPFAAVVGDPFSEEPYGIGLPKDRPEFTRFVNAVLEEARTDGTWQELYDAWLASILGGGTRPPAGSYR